MTWPFEKAYMKTAQIKALANLDLKPNFTSNMFTAPLQNGNALALLSDGVFQHIKTCNHKAALTHSKPN